MQKNIIMALSLLLSGCASNNMDVDNLLPRYVSQVYYLVYSCKQLRLTNLEFQQAKSTYQLYKMPRPDLAYIYQQKNEIAKQERRLDQKGQSILLGHEIALQKAANNKQCQL